MASGPMMGAPESVEVNRSVSGWERMTTAKVWPMPGSHVPKVTVITPARNVATFLPATMRSVLAQTLTDFEYLVVDNASDDATPAVVASMADRDDRVRLLSESRLGSGAARNRALAQARGQYLAFVDGDDTWLPTKLQKQVEQIEALSPRFGAVFCRSVTTNEIGEELFIYSPPEGPYDLASFLTWCNPAANGSSFLVRREVYEQIGGFDETLRSLIDMEWLLRLARDSTSPMLLATTDTLVRYRRRPGSVSSDATARMAALEEVVSAFDTGRDPLVWLRPALLAYRAGRLADAKRFSARARRAGWHKLLRERDGRRLAAFELGLRFGRGPTHLAGAGDATATIELTDRPAHTEPQDVRSSSAKDASG